MILISEEAGFKDINPKIHPSVPKSTDPVLIYPKIPATAIYAYGALANSHVKLRVVHAVEAVPELSQKLYDSFFYI